MKLWTECQKTKARKLLKQRLDFAFETILKLWIDLLRLTATKLLKQRLEFLFEKEIDTTDRLRKLQNQTIFETRARFSI